MNTRPDVIPYVSPMATLEQKEAEEAALTMMASSAMQAARAVARQHMADHPIARIPDGAARLDYALDKWMGQLALQDYGGDVSRPVLLWTTSLARYRWFGHEFPGSGAAIDCTDNIYRNAGLQGSSRYELHGQMHPHRPAQFSFHLTNHPDADGFDTTPDMGDVGGYQMITDDNLVAGADGSFVITLDAEPAGGRVNHIRTVPGKKLYLLGRDTLSDWREAPNTLRLRYNGGAPLPAPMTLPALAESAASKLEQFVKFWLRFNDQFHTACESNTVAAPYARTGGLGWAAAGRFDLRDDQAMVITVADGGARYAGMQVTDPWMIGPSPLEHLSSYTFSQAQPNPDGTRTYILSRRDPGVGNWVDTAGLHRGWIYFRWQGVPAGFTDGASLLRGFEVVSTSDAARAMPFPAPEITAEERRAQLRRRAEEWSFRLSTGGPSSSRMSHEA
jgi:hypothetical protein